MFLLLLLLCLDAGAQEEQDPLPSLTLDVQAQGALGPAATHLIPAEAYDPALGANASGEARPGATYSFASDQGGTYHLQAHSFFFDALVLVKNTEGQLLGVDDDGWFGTQPGIEVALDPGEEIRIEVISGNGRYGPFTVELLEGQAPALSLEQRTELHLADAHAQIEAWIQAYEGDPEWTADAMLNLSSVEYGYERYADALQTVEEVHQLVNSELGPTHHLIRVCLNRLNLLYQFLGYHAKAEQANRAEQEFMRQTGLGGSDDYAISLNNLGILLLDMNRPGEAATVFEEGLELRTRLHGVDGRDSLMTRVNLAEARVREGQFALAEELFQRSLASAVKNMPGNHRFRGLIQHRYAVALQEAGFLDQAAHHYRRAVMAHQDAFGPESSEVASSLSNLAVVLGAQSRYAESRALIQQVLPIVEQNASTEPSNLSAALISLAGFSSTMGLYGEAIHHAERALAFDEKVMGPESERVVYDLQVLAPAYFNAGQVQQAMGAIHRAEAIALRGVGPDHPLLLDLRGVEAGFHFEMGDYAQALQIIEDVVGRRTTLQRMRDASAISDLTLLGTLQLSMGGSSQGADALEHARSAQLSFHRAAEIAADLDAPRPLLAARTGVARSLAQAGELSDSLRTVEAAIEEALQYLHTQVYLLREAERMGFLDKIGEAVRFHLGLAQSVGGEPVLRRACDQLMNWKGIATRVQGLTLARVHQSTDPAQLAQVHEIQAQQRLISKLLTISDDPANDPLLTQARQRRTLAEGKLLQAGGAGVSGTRLHWKEVRSALEPGEALVDFVLIDRRADPRLPTADGHVSAAVSSVQAWVTLPSSSAPQVLDLGPVEEIESLVRRFLANVVATRSGGRVPPKAGEVPLEQQVFERLWAPCAELVGTSSRLYLAPDGFLGAFPFSTLTDSSGRYLLEDHQFVRIQDLGVLLASAPDRAPPAAGILLVGGVDYNRAGGPGGGDPAAAQEGAGRSGRNSYFPQLAHSEPEINALSEMFRAAHPDAPPPKVLRGSAATEGAVRAQASSWGVVHLSTHGFFQSGTHESLWSFEPGPDGRIIPMTTTSGQALVQNFPGLASGVVLAGANDRGLPGADDGLLTAEEWSWLDLSRVRMVVLSACETALGEVQAGEGMLGLQRTLHTAGARTVISSVWEVPDEHTFHLMVEFYRRLWLEGDSTIEALRGAQLKLLHQNRLRHGQGLPYSWGGFVLSGDWR